MPLSDYFESMKGATPVEPATIPPAPQIPNDQTQVSGYLRTTLPLPLQYAPDTLKQYNRPGMSSFRIAPLPPSGLPAVNSASQSVTTTSIHEFSAVAAVGPNGAVQFNNGGGLDGVAQFEWLNATSTLAITGTIALVGTANATIFNATTGFEIGGTAATGQYLRGNGTNFVSAVLSGSDIATGIVGVTYGGTGSNLSATGGTSQVLKQATVGGNITVAQLAFTDISGILGVTQGGTGANLSATGGAHQVVQQSSVGGVFTVGQLAFTDISGILGITQGGTGTSTPALVQGNDITITGTWPNNTIAVKTQSGVTAGSYTTTNITVDAQRIITAISNGSGGPTIISVNLAAQGANVSATNLLASATAGTYIVTIYLVVSRAATSSSTLPDSRIIYTDQDSGATITIPVTSGLTTNTLSTFAQATFIVNAKSATAIQYDVGQVTPFASSGATSMQFAYHARAVFLN